MAVGCTTYLMAFKQGKAVREGAGLSLLYYAPMTNRGPGNEHDFAASRLAGAATTQEHRADRGRRAGCGRGHSWV